jgi:hypothetical protein
LISDRNANEECLSSKINQTSVVNQIMRINT